MDDRQQKAKKAKKAAKAQKKAAKKRERSAKEGSDQPAGKDSRSEFAGRMAAKAIGVDDDDKDFFDSNE